MCISLSYLLPVFCLFHGRQLFPSFCWDNLEEKEEEQGCLIIQAGVAWAAKELTGLAGETDNAPRTQLAHQAAGKTAMHRSLRAVSTADLPLRKGN